MYQHGMPAVASQFIMECVRDLIAGVDGDEIVEKLRSRYNTSSFITNLSLVKKVYFMKGIKHERYDSTLQRFSASARSNHTRRIRKLADSFFEKSVHQQYLSQLAHRRKKFTFGDKDVDRHFRLIKIVPQNMESLRATSKESWESKKRATSQQIKKNESVVFVNDGSSLLNNATTLLSSVDATTPLYSLISALLLVSGRRTCEILNCQSSFLPVDGFEYAALFGGQLKTRQDASYVIPILVEFHVFERAYHVLRTRQGRGVPATSNDQVHARYSSSLSRWLKKNYIVHGITCHSLRSIYARMVFESFATARLSFPRIAQTVLGHGSMAMSLYYQAIELSGFEDHKSVFGDFPCNLT